MISIKYFIKIAEKYLILTQIISSIICWSSRDQRFQHCSKQILNLHI